jgi:hypothetical protein
LPKPVKIEQAFLCCKKVNNNTSMTSHQEQLIKIAVVGDIHDLWEAEDAIALHELGVDLVLFVGDFGNEAVEVVQMIASIDIPKAAIMGQSRCLVYRLGLGTQAVSLRPRQRRLGAGTVRFTG